MKKFSKPTTSAFVLNPVKSNEFFESKLHTSSEALERFNKNQKKSKDKKDKK